METDNRFIFAKVTRDDLEKSSGGANMILAVEKDRSQNLIIKGCAGSGKTTIALLRAISWEKRNLKTIFFIYNNLLKTYLQGLSEDYPVAKITTFLKWYGKEFGTFFYKDSSEEIRNNFARYVAQNGQFDAIIVDEGQDLPLRFYQNAEILTKHITICGDSNQRANLGGDELEEGTTIENICRAISDSFVVTLTHNFRNTKEIYSFSAQVLPENEIVNQEIYYLQAKSDPNSIPVVKKCENIENELDGILSFIKENSMSGRNIIILTEQTSRVDKIKEHLDKKNISCVKHYSSSPLQEIKSNVLLTTFRSARGIEAEFVVSANISSENSNFTREDLYSAFTRAKNKLLVTYIGDKHDYIKKIPKNFFKHE